MATARANIRKICETRRNRMHLRKWFAIVAKPSINMRASTNTRDTVGVGVFLGEDSLMEFGVQQRQPNETLDATIQPRQRHVKTPHAEEFIKGWRLNHVQREHPEEVHTFIQQSDVYYLPSSDFEERRRAK